MSKRASTLWHQLLLHDPWSRTESDKIVQHLSGVKLADTTRAIIVKYTRARQVFNDKTNDAINFKLGKIAEVNSKFITDIIISFTWNTFYAIFLKHHYKIFLWDRQSKINLMYLKINLRKRDIRRHLEGHLILALCSYKLSLYSSPSWICHSMPVDREYK